MYLFRVQAIEKLPHDPKIEIGCKIITLIKDIFGYIDIYQFSRMVYPNVVLHLSRLRYTE